MNPRTAFSFVLVAVPLTFVVACGGKKDSSPPSSDGPASASPAASTGGAKGLAAVPPKLAADVQKAIACKSFDVGFDSNCADYKAYYDQKDDFIDGKADAALVNLLEDSSEKVRYLGAMKLNQYGKTFATDKALAARVVAAAAAETSKFSAYEMGSAAGRVRSTDTGLTDKQAAIVKTHAVPEVRRGMLGYVLFTNGENNAIYDLVRDTVKDKDKGIGLAALQAFWVGGSHRVADTCKLYADNVDNADDSISAEATNALPWYRQCSSSYDALLASIGKRVDASKVPSASFATALKHVCEPDGKASDAQKKTAQKIAKSMAEAKSLQGWTRASAIDALVTCDPKGEKKELKKLASDADADVKKKAAELLAAK